VKSSQARIKLAKRSLGSNNKDHKNNGGDIIKRCGFNPTIKSVFSMTTLAEKTRPKIPKAGTGIWMRSSREVLVASHRACGAAREAVADEDEQ
jgi:hypothetical protein